VDWKSRFLLPTEFLTTKPKQATNISTWLMLNLYYLIYNYNNYLYYIIIFLYYNILAKVCCNYKTSHLLQSIVVQEMNGRDMVVYIANKDKWSADGALALPDALGGNLIVVHTVIDNENLQ